MSFKGLSPFTTPNHDSVYRSLSSLATAQQQMPIVGERLVEAKNNNNSTMTKIPTLPVPFSSFPVNRCNLFNDVDLKEMESKLNTVCSKVVFEHTCQVCQFLCEAEAKDGNETVRFTCNIWNVEGHNETYGKNFLIEITRTSGCPFWFNANVLGAIIGKPCKKQLFRVPELPKECKDIGQGIRKECMLHALMLATCEIQEQRTQSICTLADLCNSDNFVLIFNECGGKEQICKLKDDANPVVRRAAHKILSVVC